MKKLTLKTPIEAVNEVQIHIVKCPFCKEDKPCFSPVASCLVIKTPKTSFELACAIDVDKHFKHSFGRWVYKIPKDEAKYLNVIVPNEFDEKKYYSAICKDCASQLVKF